MTTTPNPATKALRRGPRWGALRTGAVAGPARHALLRHWRGIIRAI